MSCKLISKENNKAKIEIEVGSVEFENYVNKAYMKNRGKFNIQGFRKGKAPRKLIETNYGEEIFFDDAFNELFPKIYDEAIKELDLTPVSRPDVDVLEIGKGVDLKFTAEVDIKPEVEITKYKKLKVKKPNVEVSKEDLDNELEKMAQTNARLIAIEDRPVQEGDIVIIDYKGSVDGVEFEGGSASNKQLTIGSEEFIPGFEGQLIGSKIGDDVKVNVTFPEDYQDEKLKGAEAVFEVKIHEIKVKEVPELDDEFAIDTSEFETLKELKDSVEKYLKEQKEKNAENEVKNIIIDLVVENAKVDIPDSMIDSEIEYMIKDMEYQLSYSGIKMEQYLSITNTTIEDLKEKSKEDAIKKVKMQLVTEKIGELEDIQVSDEEAKEEVVEIAKNQNSTVEEIDKVYSKDNYQYLKDSLKARKTIDFLVENANIVE